MFSTQKEVKFWLDEYKITNYTINEDLSVDVKGDVNLTDKKLTHLPIQFNNVTEDFYCDDNFLTDMQGFPRVILGDINCWNNKISSFKGCPYHIEGSLYCQENQLRSLEFCIEKIGKTFCCSENKIPNLKFGPKYVGADYICHSNQIISFASAPIEVAGKMDFYDNPLERIDDLKTIFFGKFRHSVMDYHKKIKGLEDYYNEYGILELNSKTIQAILLANDLTKDLENIKISKLKTKI